MDILGDLLSFSHQFWMSSLLPLWEVLQQNHPLCLVSSCPNLINFNWKRAFTHLRDLKLSINYFMWFTYLLFLWLHKLWFTFSFGVRFLTSLICVSFCLSKSTFKMLRSGKLIKRNFWSWGWPTRKCQF